jgi:hypothetical protein
MKTQYFFMISLVFLTIAVFYTQHTKEGFLNDYCQQFKDCNSCASASGCSWCPKAKSCLNSTTLKSTDKDCNQMNVINSNFSCQSEMKDKIPPPFVETNDILYDWTLYKNKITDKIPPPNLYMAGKIKYSNEDVISNSNDVRNYITNLHTELPGIIASGVENNIKPMVKGILSENYYIQGFKNMN